MVRKKEKVSIESRQSPFNGENNIVVRDLLNGPEEMYDKGRVFAHTTVPVGSSIGFHIHKDESETYYILSGSGKFNDNGVMVDVHPGDVYYTPAGTGHGIEADGNEPIEMIALILYKGK